jgi:hypothetical protein
MNLPSLISHFLPKVCLSLPFALVTTKDLI